MRRFVGAALALMLAACAGGGGETRRSGVTMQSLADETVTAFNMVFPPDPELVPGENRLVFAILDAENAFVPSLDLELYFAKSPDAKPFGPVDVSFEDDGLGDRSFYKAIVDFDSTGDFVILVRDDDEAGDRKKGAGTQLKVKKSTPVVRVGNKAISIRTPTEADHLGLEEICTREPDDPMHMLSLDEALTNGKRTVVTFATPALCASRVCGPVVDQVLRVANDIGDRANFVHVEVFTDRSGKTFTEGMQAWKLQTEPWTFVIDSSGIIRGRFEGPVTTGEIKDALEEAS